MIPTDLLKTLETESVAVSLTLKVSADARPSDDTRALIRDNRDALLEHLIADSNVRGEAHLEEPSNYQRAGSLHLYGDLLNSLMVWVGQYYELRLEHPGGTNLDAKPDHVTGALTRYPWGVVYTAERYALLTWGDVPTSALLDKRDLLTDEPLVPETRAA